MLFEGGGTVKQVAAWLGHSDLGFTQRTHIHMLDDDLGGPLDLASELGHAGTY